MRPALQFALFSLVASLFPCRLCLDEKTRSFRKLIPKWRYIMIYDCGKKCWVSLLSCCHSFVISRMHCHLIKQWCTEHFVYFPEALIFISSCCGSIPWWQLSNGFYMTVFFQDGLQLKCFIFILIEGGTNQSSVRACITMFSFVKMISHNDTNSSISYNWCCKEIYDKEGFKAKSILHLLLPCVYFVEMQLVVWPCEPFI